MDSQDSPTVIPCSEEIMSVAEENVSVLMEPPPPHSNNSSQQTTDDSSQSQSLLADIDKSTANQNDYDISGIDVSEIRKTKITSVNSPSVLRDSVSNSIVDMESSEINPMSSTRIEQDNSISLLNEGFMIDSASLSLSAVDSRLDPEKTTTEANDSEEMESTQFEPEDEVMEDDSVDLHRSKSKPSDRKESTESDGGEEDENSDDYPVPQFPMARVKRIMAICAAAEDDEIGQDIDTTNKSKKNKGTGKANMLITKEAIYLTTLATEHFISVIGKMAGDVTASSKKKTLTLEHLKRAVSDTDAFAFLEGCFQPSLIIGD